MKKKKLKQTNASAHLIQYRFKIRDVSSTSGVWGQAPADIKFDNFIRHSLHQVTVTLVTL